MLVGVPAVGKSTWIEKEFQGECAVISTDDIIQVMADIEGKTYDDVFLKYIKPAERTMWDEFDEAIEGEMTPIVIDRTNVSVQSRKKFFDRLNNFHKNHGYEIEAVVFQTPEKDEWERRLNNRPGKTIPQNILDNMVQSMVQPTLSEGFSKISISS
jgi:predicted kinase